MKVLAKRLAVVALIALLAVLFCRGSGEATLEGSVANQPTNGVPPGTRPVWETKTKVINYKVMRPVWEIKTKVINDTVTRPSWEERGVFTLDEKGEVSPGQAPERTYSVCKMVPERKSRRVDYKVCRMEPMQLQKEVEYKTVRFEPIP